MYRIKTFVDRESLTFVGRFFIVFAIAYSLVTGISFYFVVGEWRTYAANNLSAIEKNDNASIFDTCLVVGCRYIEIDGNKIYVTENDQFTERKPTNNKLLDILNSAIVVPVKNTTQDVVFGLPITNLIAFYSRITLILYIFLMALSLVFLIKYLIRSNIKSLVNGASNTASLHNKNMATLAEQLHHELNTPLSVVKELCDKVFSQIEEASECDTCSEDSASSSNSSIPKRYEDMRILKMIIDNNIKQAFVFIERMADVKQIRYSNGNKSLYDITKATFDVMGVFNRANYTFEIDNSLRDYRINHLSGLKNHELMNILVNHIKNSLEAGSSHIVVSINKVVDYKPTKVDNIISGAIDFVGKYGFGWIGAAIILMLYKCMSLQAKASISKTRIALVDNGSGIPVEFQDKIFNLNSSTKNKNGVIRGAGLYLNRQILLDSLGDLWLHETGPHGTTFILDVPAEKINTIKKQ